MFEGLRRQTFAWALRLHRSSYRVLLATWAIMALVLIFERQVDACLHLLGYDDRFVSHFGFIESQYRFLVDSRALPDISVAHFHMLEIAAWLAVAVAGAVLLSAARLIWRYEGPYQMFYDRLSEDDKTRLVLAVMFFLPLLAFVLSSMAAQSEARPYFSIMQHAPRAYFFMVAAGYGLFAWLTSLSMVMFGWLAVWGWRRRRHRA